MRKILSLLMLSIFVNLYAQFDVKITNIVIDKTYPTNPTQFALPNNEASYSVKINYTVNLTDKQNAYAIHGLNFKVNGQVYAVMNTGLTMNSSYPYSGQAQYNLNIGSPSAIDFMVELPYHKQVFPVEGTEYNRSNTWRLNFYKPLSNNSIDTPITEFDYKGAPVTVKFTGSVPIGGNGSFTYKWYRKRWDDTVYREIIGATSKDLTTSLDNNTVFFREVYSNNGNVSNSSNLVKLKILRNIKITHNNIDNQFITNKTRYYDNNLENFPDVDPFGLVDLGSVKEVIGSTPQLLDYPNYDWNLLFDFQWQMSENGLNWIDIPNANNININIFNHNLNAYSNVYIRRKANSELVRDVNYSNTLKLIRLDLQKLENNSIFRASDFTKIDGSTPIGGNGLFYQQWMWKCYNDEKYYLLLVNNDDVNNVYGLKNINTILKNNENFSNKNCENRYKLIRKVIVNGDQYIEGRFDIGISMQYINSNELNLNFNTNIVREKMINVISNESVINLFLDNISNETLKVMVWDISNPSLFNEFNVKATSKQIKLNKTFNKGIYAYKVLDSNNIIVKEGKFVIK